MKRAAAPVVNPANAITLARALTAPFIVWLAVRTDGPSAAAAALFAVAAASDALDGYVARSRNLVTDLGTLLDPFVDKLLICSALTAVAATGRVGSWVVLTVLAREVGVTWMRSMARQHGVLLGALAMGKAKMGLQCVTVIVLLLAPSSHATWVEILVLAMVAATLASWVDYWQALRRGGVAINAEMPRVS